MVIGIDYGNWKRPIDTSIIGTQVTWFGELRIPFACHVRQPRLIAPPDMSFHQFTRLPAELQIHILRCCDKPTLFRLMQTSHAIRLEAAKLFFSDPQAWYIVDNDWFEEGGHPTDGVHDMDFLRHVQYLRLSLDYTLKLRNSPPSDEEIRSVWERLRFIFPRVTDVTLNDLSKKGEPCKCSRRFGQLSPPGINVLYSTLQRRGLQDGERWRRRYWRLSSSQEDKGGIKELDVGETCAEPGIMVPHKPFRGRLGIAQRLYTLDCALTSEKLAIRVLRLAAIERSHFYERKGPFKCPAPDCGVLIEKAEEYTSHVVTRSSNAPHDDDYSLSEPSSSLFIDMNERLIHRVESFRKDLNTFMEWWGPSGSEKRKIATEQLSHELEDDALRVQNYAHNPLCLKKPLLEQIEDWGS